METEKVKTIEKRGIYMFFSWKEAPRLSTYSANPGSTPGIDGAKLACAESSWRASAATVQTPLLSDENSVTSRKAGTT